MIQKFDVDSASTVRFMWTTRNHEFRAQMGYFGWQAQIDIAGSPDKVDLKLEHAVKLEPYRLQISNL